MGISIVVSTTSKIPLAASLLIYTPRSSSTQPKYCRRVHSTRTRDDHEVEAQSLGRSEEGRELACQLGIEEAHVTGSEDRDCAVAGRWQVRGVLGEGGRSLGVDIGFWS